LSTSSKIFDSIATISLSGLVKRAGALDLLVVWIFHVEHAKRVQILLRGAVVVDNLEDHLRAGPSCLDVASFFAFLSATS
jgi:hypothetical protein